MPRNYRLDQSLFLEVNTPAMYASRCGSREVEIPILEERVIRPMQECATDIFPENAPVLILLDEVLTEPRSKLPITRVRAHANDASLAMRVFAFFE